MPSFFHYSFTLFVPPLCIMNCPLFPYALFTPCLHSLFPFFPSASINSQLRYTLCYMYLYFCSTLLSQYFNTIGIKCWRDLLGILKQAGILVRLFECLIFSARHWLKPLKCFGNTYSTVAPMKPIKFLIWMRKGKGLKRGKGIGDTICHYFLCFST